jgi:hypothetical protein
MTCHHTLCTAVLPLHRWLTSVRVQLPAFRRLAARLLPKLRTLWALLIRVPNWIARFSLPAARVSPTLLATARSSALSPNFRPGLHTSHRGICATTCTLSPAFSLACWRALVCSAQLALTNQNIEWPSHTNHSLGKVNNKIKAKHIFWGCEFSWHGTLVCKHLKKVFIQEGMPRLPRHICNDPIIPSQVAPP